METKDLGQKVSEKLVIILVLTLFTLIFWGGVKVVESFTQKPSGEDISGYLKPIPTPFDQKVLDELVKRKKENQPVQAPATTEQTTETTQ